MSTAAHPYSPAPAGSAPPATSERDRRRVVAATVVGTTVEWYDFFIYAQISALLFGQLFFAGFGDANVTSYITMGLSFLFRPLGAVIAGHLGDRLGRRLVLTITLITMGVATMLIGLLPTYNSWAGWLAPILLILLRILQGISAGGEWGGAVLLAVEHAPVKKRGLFGASPQIGVPIGLVAASLMVALMRNISGENFAVWGWRIPFLFSALLIVVGYLVRRAVEESPVYAEIAERRATSTAPISQLFKNHSWLVIVAAFVFAGNNAVGYMSTGGFIQSYATKTLGMEISTVSTLVAASGLVWLASTFLGGWVCDLIGRRTTYLIGWVALAGGVLTLFPMVKMASPAGLFGALAILSIGLGLTYGPQSALYAELFPASIRFSGVSISYAIGSIAGGAFAPTIAAQLQKTSLGTTAITIYLLGMVALGLVATLLLKVRDGIPLGPEHEEEQATNALRIGS